MPNPIAGGLLCRSYMGSPKTQREHLTSPKISAQLHQLLSLQSLPLVPPALYQGQSPWCALAAANPQIIPAGDKPLSHPPGLPAPSLAPLPPAGLSPLSAFPVPIPSSFTLALPSFFRRQAELPALSPPLPLTAAKDAYSRDPGFALSHYTGSASPSASLAHPQPVSFFLASSGASLNRSPDPAGSSVLLSVGLPACAGIPAIPKPASHLRHQPRAGWTVRCDISNTGTKPVPASPP